MGGGGEGIGANGASADEPPSPRMDLCAQRFLALPSPFLTKYGPTRGVMWTGLIVGVRNAIIEC